MTGTFDGRTAAQWREMATKCYRDRAESWERSDTDGFLSQWASGQMASRYQALADIADNDGFMWDRAFVDIATGELLKGRWFDGQYGSCYRTLDGRFINPSYAKKAATREANMAKKGYRAVIIKAPAHLNGREMRAYIDPNDEWVIDEAETVSWLGKDN